MREMVGHYDDYRRQASYCMAMADASRSDHIKTEWLSLAGKWLSLIPGQRNAETAFEDMLRARGTGQEESSSSH